MYMCVCVCIQFGLDAFAACCNQIVIRCISVTVNYFVKLLPLFFCQMLCNFPKLDPAIFGLRNDCVWFLGHPKINTGNSKGSSL